MLWGAKFYFLDTYNINIFQITSDAKFYFFRHI